jgi:hypothetical protein
LFLKIYRFVSKAFAGLCVLTTVATDIDLPTIAVVGEFPLEVLEVRLDPTIVWQKEKALVSNIPSSRLNMGDMMQYMKKLRAELRERNTLEVMPRIRTQSGRPENQ